MKTNEQSDVVFELKEYEGGKPWIFVSFDNVMSCFKDTDLFGLQFRDGVTFDEAKAFRAQLHKMIKGVSLIRF